MNDELEKKLQQQLRASEGELDGPTLARLHAVRNCALEAAGGRRELRWSGIWLGAAAATGVAAIVLLVSLRQPTDDAGLPATVFENTLLAAAGNEAIIDPVTGEPVNGDSNAAETLDLLENLEFYEWLSQEEAQEQQT
jgi:hypothetical protein